VYSNGTDKAGFDDRIARLEAAILRHAGGIERFRSEIPRLFRRAIDEVIDTQRSGRYTLAETEKTEKTYLGTKIEIFLRNHLKMSKGHTLDLSIEDFEADIKCTSGSNWTIRIEAVGHPCVLIKTDEAEAFCSFGLVVVKEDILNPGRRTISRSGFERIHWILWNERYPPDSWQFPDPAVRKQITDSGGSTEGIPTLFRSVRSRPISRQLAADLAQQNDALKRIRRNGGARDLLAPLG
jgi:hypothetical protein